MSYVRSNRETERLGFSAMGGGKRGGIITVFCGPMREHHTREENERAFVNRKSRTSEMLESCERRLMQGDLPRCDFDLAELRHFVSLSEELFGYWLLLLYLSTQPIHLLILRWQCCVAEFYSQIKLLCFILSIKYALEKIQTLVPLVCVFCNGRRQDEHR